METLEGSGTILPFDQDLFRRAPRVFSQHVTCRLENDAATLIFSQRANVSPNPQEVSEIALPQVICFMTLTHFLAFADMIELQAANARKQLRKQGINLDADATQGE